MLRFIRELFENVRIAVLALTGNRLRTGLTLLGIGIGVATLIAIVGVIQGLNLSFASQIGKLGSNMLQVSKRPWIITGGWWKFRNRPDLSMHDVEAIRAGAPMAAAVAPMMNDAMTVTFGSDSLDAVSVTGSNEEFHEARSMFPSVGRPLLHSDVEFGRRVVVLGADVADQLFGGPPAAVGHTMRLGSKPYLVVGVLERKGKLFGQSLDLMAAVPLTAFANDFGQHHGMDIAVTASDPGALNTLEDQLLSVLRRSRHLSPEAEENFAINRQDQLTKVYNNLTGALYGVATGVGLITLIVGGIGIMNIMLVSVRERTREIGVRRALGARRRTIVIQFLFESVAVSLVGGMGGTAFGLLCAWLVGQLTPLAAAVTPQAVGVGVVFSTLVGVLFGLWPAWSASMLDPVEALRYE